VKIRTPIKQTYVHNTSPCTYLTCYPKHGNINFGNKYASIIFLRRVTLRQNDTTQTTAEARFLEKSKG
jgi:hypothetical protein